MEYSWAWQGRTPVGSENLKEGLPQGLNGEELDGQCRRPQVDPWSGKIPHGAEAAGRVNPSTAHTEPVLWSPAPQLLSPHAARTESRGSPEPALRSTRQQPAFAQRPGAATSKQMSVFVFVFLIFIFTLFYFTILYWFCHTLT